MSPSCVAAGAGSHWASPSVFSVALRSYRLNIQKSFFQKDLNFAVDSIANTAKSASSIPVSYNGYTTGQNTLVIAVPAKDNQNNFVYNANILQHDYYVYYVSSDSLIKRVYGNAGGKLSSESGSPVTILNNLSNFTLTYNPDIPNAKSVSINLALAKTIGNHNVSVSQSRTANLRNK